MVIPPEDRSATGLRDLVAAHPNIRFVSLAGVDLGGNETDERIPVCTFLADAETLLTGGVQTDGSSVVLPGIATLNDGKVDLIADPDAPLDRRLQRGPDRRRDRPAGRHRAGSPPSSSTRASASIRAPCWPAPRRRRRAAAGAARSASRRGARRSASTPDDDRRRCC